jgi:isopropylmalate/homocitrate/citramalate synthase
MEQRTKWCRKELHPGSRVFFNIRDFQLAWPQNPQRVLEVVEFLAKLPEETRPTGLNFEDQNGSWIPAVMSDATESVRRVMVENGWAAGHLLLHVHKGYGLSDASQLAAIGAGATGIWCGVTASVPMAP